ncbi:MAG: cell division protein SepF [Clostridia bacterium]
MSRFDEDNYNNYERDYYGDREPIKRGYADDEYDNFDNSERVSAPRNASRYDDYENNFDTRYGARETSRDYGERQEREPYQEQFAQPLKKKRSIFSSFRHTGKGSKLDVESYSPYTDEVPANVIISYPQTYAEVQSLIDTLKRRQPLIVDLQKISDDSAQRILDFMSGAIYGLSGSMHRISGSIFLLTPEGMSIQVPMDLRKNLENKKRN